MHPLEQGASATDAPLQESFAVTEPPRPVSTLRWLLPPALLYVALALLSQALTGQPVQVVTLWLANPVGTVALLAQPWRRWPPMLLALLTANLLANLVAGTPLQGWNAAAWRAAAAFVPGNGLEMVLAAALLRRYGVDEDMLQQPGRLGRALLLGALLPSFCSAFAGAAVLVAAQPQTFAELWLLWFAGSLIGTVAVLPLALSLWLQGWTPLRVSLAQPRTLGLLLLSLLLTLLAASALPHPFVMVTIALVLVGAQTHFSLTALATLLSAISLACLMARGVLLPPASSAWWGGSLFYSAVLASLLPALFLAASVEGQARIVRALASSEQRFRSLYTSTPAMLQSIDPRGRLISVSRLWLDKLGYAEHEVLGRPATDFLTPESARHARDVVIPQAMRNGRCDDVEYRMVCRNGDVLDVLLSAIWVYDADGQPLYSLAAVQDVTEKKRLAALSHFAAHDPLTGLPNRMLLQDRLERSCTQHARHGSRFAVGFLDLDHFKDINDTHGHEAGDALLQIVARRLQAALRASDTVCRLAGDEFVLLFSEIEATEDLDAIAHKLLERVAQPCRLGPAHDAPLVDVGASMGVAVFPEHGQDPHTLLQHADQAMYAAKRGGRNRCAFYRPEDAA